MTGFEWHRRKNLLNQQQLSEMVGVTQTAVSAWELQKAYPSVEKLKITAAVLGATTDELLRTDYPDNCLGERG